MGRFGTSTLSNGPPSIRRPRKGAATGFTLVEVLIALALVAVALVVLLGSNVASARLSDEAAHRIRATLLAQARMAELVSATGLTIGSAEGSFEADDAFGWSSEVAEFSLPQIHEGSRSDLRRVQVRVTWQDGRAERGVSLVSLVCVRD